MYYRQTESCYMYTHAFKVLLYLPLQPPHKCDYIDSMTFLSLSHYKMLYEYILFGIRTMSTPPLRIMTTLYRRFQRTVLLLVLCLQYAQETQHEKILRGLAVGIALTMYGRLEEADTLIESLTRDKDPILRRSGMYTIAMAYCGTGNNNAIRKLLHIAVSNKITIYYPLFKDHPSRETTCHEITWTSTTVHRQSLYGGKATSIFCSYHSNAFSIV